MSEMNTDEVNESYVSILRLLKGAVVLMLTLGAKLIQLQQILGDSKFATFVRTRLPFDLVEAELFMRLAKTPGLAVADFTPPVEVKLPQLMEVYRLVVAAYVEINGTAQDFESQDCDGSGDAAITNDDTQTETNDTVTMDAIGDMIPAVAGDDAVALVIPVILAGTADTSSQCKAPTAVEEPVANQPAITAAQRKFLAERSVKLLVRVTKGELPPEAAMRQAEMMPTRKAQ